MSIRISLFVLIVVSVLSCSLETDPIVITNINTTPPINLLKEIQKDGVTTSTYTYQDSVLQSSSFFGSTTIVTEYTYNNDTIISTQMSDGVLSFERKYYNVSETEGIRERRNSLGELVDVRTYTFNGSACGFQNFVTLDMMGNQTNAGNYSYSNDFCDGSFRRFDSNMELVDTDSFLKDGKPAANTSVMLPFFQIATKSNIVSFVKVVNEQIDSSKSYSAAFDYNIDQYPQEEIRTYFDGTVEEYVFIYE